MPQRIVFPEPGRVELQTFALPAPGPEDLRLRTLYSLMSIGTETTILHARYDAGTHFDRIFSFPQLKTGVLAVARVEAAGAGVTGVAPGDLVFIRMAHGSHQVLPAVECYPVPAAVDPPDACWAGLAKTAFRAAWAGDFEHRDSVLIVGAGPVGQMLVRWAAACGIDRIVVADPAAARLRHAEAGGAHVTLCGPLEALTAGLQALWPDDGPTLVVDTTGNAGVFAAALGVAGRFGTVLLLGDTGYPGRQCLTSDVMTKGLTILATHDGHDRDGWTEPRVVSHFYDVVAAGRFPLEGLITHRFEPADCAGAYALAEDRRGDAMGILFDWRDPAFDEQSG